MRRLALALLLVPGPACRAAGDLRTRSQELPETEQVLERIAFASCIRQGRPQPAWTALNEGDPQLFLFLGDNIYGDSEDPDVLAERWGQLVAEPGYLELAESCRILGTWDDHDYGVNDGGAEFPAREVSEQLFLDFLGVPAASPRRSRAGVYHAESFGPAGRRVQVILLDTRYHRTALARAAVPPENTGPYVPSDDPEQSVLGAEQWSWLEQRLREPADLRLLVSSIQLVPTEHGWEKWGNFPRERRRLLELLHTTAARGVVVLSGDRHAAEFSKLEPGDELAGPDYPLWEFTSSAFNVGLTPVEEPNAYRVGERVFAPNYGTLTVAWDAPEPHFVMEIHGEDGAVVRRQSLSSTFAARVEESD